MHVQEKYKFSVASRDSNLLDTMKLMVDVLQPTIVSVEKLRKTGGELCEAVRNVYQRVDHITLALVKYRLWRDNTISSISISNIIYCMV